MVEVVKRLHQSQNRSAGNDINKITAGIFLFIIIFCSFLFSYNGIPITDDEQLFISAAINQANTGEFSANQLYGNERLEGNYYGIGPVHVMIGSFAYRLIVNSNLGGMQVMYLLSPLYLSISAVIIYLLSKRRGFSTSTAFISAFIYAFGTMNWVYSKTFFREPLAVTFLLLMWFCYDVMIDEKTTSDKKIPAGICFFFAWLGILFTKVILAGVIIFFLLGYIFKLYERKIEKNPSQHLIYFLLLGIAPAVLILYIFISGNFLPDYFANRVSDELVFRTWERIQMISHQGFLQAIAGSLFSPGKGFFIYNPILILGVISSIVFWKKNFQWNFIAWGILSGLVVIQCLIYDDGWWNITWSTRYLIPAIPGFVLVSQPLMERLLFTKRTFLKISFFSMVILAGFIELGGVIISDPTYNRYLYSMTDNQLPENWIWQLKYVPLIGHWKLVLSATSWDFAFMRTFNQSPWGVSLYLVMICFFILIGACLLFFSLKRSTYEKKEWFLWTGTVMLIFALTVVPIVLLKTFRCDDRYYSSRTDLENGFAWIESSFMPGDEVILQSYLSPAWYYAMNFSRLPTDWYSLPVIGDSSNDGEIPEQMRGTLEAIADENRRLWFFEESHGDELVVSDESEYFYIRFPVIQTRTFSDQEDNGNRITLYELIEK